MINNSIIKNKSTFSYKNFLNTNYIELSIKKV
jgi:hypothetical protein